jgi:hypothetical protein
VSAILCSSVGQHRDCLQTLEEESATSSPARLALLRHVIVFSFCLDSVGSFSAISVEPERLVLNNQDLQLPPKS